MLNSKSSRFKIKQSNLNYLTILGQNNLELIGCKNNTIQFAYLENQKSSNSEFYSGRGRKVKPKLNTNIEKKPAILYFD